MRDPLEETPLGRARRAFDEARSEIEDEIYDEIQDVPDPEEVELRVDSKSLGVEAVFEYGEETSVSADLLVERLHSILVKHGVGTVTVTCRKWDSSVVMPAPPPRSKTMVFGPPIEVAVLPLNQKGKPYRYVCVITDKDGKKRVGVSENLRYWKLKGAGGVENPAYMDGVEVVND